MKKAKKMPDAFFTLFKKIFTGCFLYFLTTITCFGYSSLLGTDLKDSVIIIINSNAKISPYSCANEAFLFANLDKLGPLQVNLEHATWNRSMKRYSQEIVYETIVTVEEDVDKCLEQAISSNKTNTEKIADVDICIQQSISASIRVAAEAKESIKESISASTSAVEEAQDLTQKAISSSITTGEEAKESIKQSISSSISAIEQAKDALIKEATDSGLSPDDVKGVDQAVKDAISDTRKNVEKTDNFINEALSASIIAAKKTENTIKDALSSSRTAAKEADDSIDQALSASIIAAKKAGDLIKNALSSSMTTGKSADAIKDAISPSIRAAKEAEDAIKTAASSTVNAVKKTEDAIKAAASSTVDAVKKTEDAIKAAASSTVNAVKNAEILLKEGVSAIIKAAKLLKEGYDVLIDANISSGCLCADEPVLLTGLGNFLGKDVSPKNSKWSYLIPRSTPPYTKKPISKEDGITPADAIDPYVQAIIPDVPLLRTVVLNAASKHAGNFLVLPHGPLSTSTVDPKMLQSFIQSLLNMVKLGGYLTGQEFYVNLVVNTAEILLKVKGLAQNVGILPSDEVLTKSFEDAITTGTDAPDAFSVPITIEAEIERSGGDMVSVEATTPYSRPIYTRPKKAKIDIDCSDCFRGTKFGTSAKNSIYATNGSWVKFKPDVIPGEDPRVHYAWWGLPSLQAWGFGRALSGVENPKQPGKITVTNFLTQAGLYALMKYRGPIPPIGCASVSNWTELFVGCKGTPDDRESMIKLEKDDDDFANSRESSWRQIFTNGDGTRYKPYEPVVCEGEDIKIVSGGVWSRHGCEWTYEWFGPGRILKEGTRDEWIISPHVLLGGLKEVDVLAPGGLPTKKSVPIETSETLTIKNMTPAMSGVYTRIAMRTGKGSGLNPAGLSCHQCFRIGQITITVKPSPPTLASNSPVCAGEDLIISLSPTTTDPTEYQWAHEGTSPMVWSAWSDKLEIVIPNTTTAMSGKYQVKAKDTQSGCVSKYPVSITLEVKELVPINLSLSKDLVYAGRQSIISASFAGTEVVAPAGGITITIDANSVHNQAKKGTDYEPFQHNMYIPEYKNSISTAVITKSRESNPGDLAKLLIITGSVTNSTKPSAKTCYIIPNAVSLTIAPLFKPAITNRLIAPICSGDTTTIALSSTLPRTTYAWTAIKGIGNVEGFAASGSSSSIRETFINKQPLSGTVIYTITPSVEDPEDPNLYILGEPKSLTVTVMPISKKTILGEKRTSVNALSFDWLPENPPHNNVTYRWYNQANKTGAVVHEGKGSNGSYSILTQKPGQYKYYITTQEDGYCENEATEVELIAKHYIQLTFDKPQLQQGDKAILTASLSGVLVAPNEGITITLNEIGSSAKKKIHYHDFAPTIYIPKGRHCVSMTITTEGFITMDEDKVLMVNGAANDYTIEGAAAITITRNPNIHIVTLAFTKMTVSGEKGAKLTASLPLGIHAGHDIMVKFKKDDASSTALVDKNYEDLKTSIIIPTGEHAITIHAFDAKNNCVIDGSTLLTLQGIEPAGYAIRKPNPRITILDKTGENEANRVITLSFDKKEVRGSLPVQLNICLPECVTSINPIHIRLHKRKTVSEAERAKKNVNYKKFLWDIIIPANSNCASVLVQTLIDRSADIKTLWLSGKIVEDHTDAPSGATKGYRVNADKINIITPKIFIPNFFSPDGDRDSDTWEIYNLDLYQSCTVKIFSRWGQMVFESTGYPEHGGWDGTYLGRPLPTGSYTYIIDLKDDSPVLSGYVAIMREDR